MWPWSRSKKAIRCPNCEALMHRSQAGSYCLACGWNVRNVRNRLKHPQIPVLVFIVIWVAVAASMKAPWWFIALGVVSTLWGIISTIHFLATVPDMEPPAGFQRSYLPLVRPNFVKAGYTLNNLGDLLFGLFFLAVSLTMAVPMWAQCAAETSDVPFYERFQCFAPIIFILGGLGVVVHHFIDRRREDSLVNHGQLAMGLVTKAPLDRQKTVEFEFSTATGESISGHHSVVAGEYEVGDDIVVLYDPASPQRHRPIASLRFYEAQHHPWNRLA